MINTPLDNFTANNIRTTHFEIGPGGKSRPSENQDNFKEFSTKDASVKLAPERIEFFK